MNLALSRSIAAALLAICAIPSAAQDMAGWTWGTARPVPEARTEVSVAAEGRVI